jgi:hypothetical protein
MTDKKTVIIYDNDGNILFTATRTADKIDEFAAVCVAENKANYIIVDDDSWSIDIDKVKVVDKTVVPLVEDQLTSKQWNLVRAKRDQLLSGTDWMIIKSIESGVELDETWSDYRQQLRDITDQENPFSITWPTKPE